MPGFARGGGYAGRPPPWRDAYIYHARIGQGEPISREKFAPRGGTPASGGASRDCRARIGGPGIGVWTPVDTRGVWEQSGDGFLQAKGLTVNAPIRTGPLPATGHLGKRDLDGHALCDPLLGRSGASGR
jgi:hypothetical protein